MNQTFFKFLSFWIIISLVFIVSASFLLMSAVGYRLNWQTLRFEKTGVMIIKTNPKEVLVDSNGVLVARKTPVNLTELLPGWYDMEISSPGYITWSRRVLVEAGYVT